MWNRAPVGSRCTLTNIAGFTPTYFANQAGNHCSGSRSRPACTYRRVAHRRPTAALISRYQLENFKKPLGENYRRIRPSQRRRQDNNPRQTANSAGGLAPRRRSSFHPLRATGFPGMKTLQSQRGSSSLLEENSGVRLPTPVLSYLSGAENTLRSKERYDPPERTLHCPVSD